MIDAALDAEIRSAIDMRVEQQRNRSEAVAKWIEGLGRPGSRNMAEAVRAIGANADVLRGEIDDRLDGAEKVAPPEVD